MTPTPTPALDLDAPIRTLSLECAKEALGMECGCYADAWPAISCATAESNVASAIYHLISPTIASLRTQLSAATERADKAEAERDDLAKKVYVPGLWKCAKCGFQLVQRVLRASDGAVGVRDEAGKHCPNDGAPLWRVTERDAGNEMVDRCGEQADRARQAEGERDAYRALIEKAVERLKLHACKCASGNLCNNGEQCSGYRDQRLAADLIAAIGKGEGT